jgi:MoaA/NifB/PqqE/SkfB family radical SAM enzyme
LNDCGDLQTCQVRQVAASQDLFIDTLKLKDLVCLIDKSIPTLGITGGEPALLESKLADLLKHTHAVLPDIHLHVLTNGRLFNNDALVTKFEGLQQHVTWGVPLYADVPDIHDYVVQSKGAFFETWKASTISPKRSIR